MASKPEKIITDQDYGNDTKIINLPNPLTNGEALPLGFADSRYIQNSLVSNGLTFTGGTGVLKLGGTLTENTVINGGSLGGYSLTLGGVGTELASFSLKSNSGISFTNGNNATFTPGGEFLVNCTGYTNSLRLTNTLAKMSGGDANSYLQSAVGSVNLYADASNYISYNNSGFVINTLISTKNMVFTSSGSNSYWVFDGNQFTLNSSYAEHNHIVNYAADYTANYTDRTLIDRGYANAHYSYKDASNLTLASQAIGDILVATSTTAYGRLGIGTSTYVLTSNGTTVSWAAPAGGSTETSVAQTSHGFSVGDAIYATGNNTYAKSKADAASTAEVVGIVTTVTDSGNFKFSPPGTVITTGVPVQLGGTVMFLSATTAGALTAVEPNSTGTISKPVMIVLNSGSLGEILSMRGVINSASASYLTTTGVIVGATSQSQVFTNGVTLSNITPGSVVFAGVGGVLSQDNANFFWDNTNKTLKLGNGTPTITLDADHTLVTTKTSTGYLSVDVQNLSNGTSASTDFIANANTATDTLNYIDLGINSSTYTDAAYSINNALGGYLYNIGGDLSIGTGTAAKIVKFHTGGTTSTQLRLTISDTISTFATTIGFPGDTRKSVAKTYVDATGDAFGLEQVSAAQSGGNPSTRLFTSSVGNAEIVFGKYTSATAFTTFGTFANGGKFTLTGLLDTPNINLGYTTTATANQTTTLTVTSNQQQFFTGTTVGQIVQLPVTSTLVLGQSWMIRNNSTQTITVNSSGSNLVFSLPTLMSVRVTCISITGTTAASWSTLVFSNSTSGGSGMTNPMTTLGDIIYGGAAGAATRLAGNATTTPFVLSSTGNGSAAAPTWITSAAASASSVVIRDASVNMSANNIISGYATTATSAATTTLTVTSAQQQFFTGTTLGQIIQMPVTSTLVTGFSYTLVNNSTVGIIVNSSGSNLIGAIPAGKTATLVCINTGVTTAAGWYMNISNSITNTQTWDIPLNNNLNIYMGAGSNTAWNCMGTLFTPKENMTVTTSSVMKWVMTSTSTGFFILAVYKQVTGGAQTLMFKTSATALGGAAGHLSATVSSITDGTLVAGTWYYALIIQNQNGPSGAGVSLAGSSTIKPFRNFAANLGNLGADGAGSAPSTITEPTGETTNGTAWVSLQI